MNKSSLIEKYLNRKSDAEKIVEYALNNDFKLNSLQKEMVNCYERTDKNKILFCGYRRSGVTFGLSLSMITNAFLNANTKIYYMSTAKMSMSRDFLRRNILYLVKEGFVTRYTAERVEFFNGSFIQLMTNSPNSMREISADYIYVDAVDEGRGRQFLAETERVISLCITNRNGKIIVGCTTEEINMREDAFVSSAMHSYDTVLFDCDEEKERHICMVERSGRIAAL